MKLQIFLCKASVLFCESSGKAADFPCKCREPSYQTLSDVNKLRLEDIEIIGAIGDSDTTAFAANSGGALDYFTEYWGASFATGTDGSWRTHTTLHCKKNCGIDPN